MSNTISSSSVDVKMLDDLAKFLHEAGKKNVHPDIKKVVNESHRLAAKPIIQGARGRLKKHKVTGNLAKSIGFVPLSTKNQLRSKVGARSFGRFKGYHGYLVNRGSVVRKTETGANRGTMPGFGYWDDTIKNEGRTSESQMTKHMQDGLEKYMQKQLKKIKIL
ncbi:hypothetical protein K5X82_07365 [Halosquirtibacter xylanolyticus]|uniref:hypothetical protein n=1 Tax=Halosquirtibacter xylanolyticus TaxID=3374599 RepID=UPI003749422F|nr:hypothetical protein K5X82_07365 [Prolixibacteraceae bacterium]